ncbi:uncharacterized protein ACLA_093860 [Aspergillus clavatus NRRL 1]|uniref:Uncharacterized protein n=1 Tax=Aspergillus clavatus (strain ATCC 1007 / CBS 513.65 / DSM 816 / NCTC 3887 / NRRL 1 / QM 1276 / 107) TaxID=344612 RepID=A1CFN8_ASPCL|nr:uncharacterized protein ACLA_093860 [Aspergillus clavatus NRRL 1]EAW11687.1 conserved hypothetical protein [Aspergillus clavatus NRRL 1]
MLPTLMLFVLQGHAALGLAVTASSITIRPSPLPTSEPTPTTPATPTTSTSGKWLIIDNTSIFWPTYTDYFYGPTTGPDAAAVTCNAKWVEYIGRSTELQSLGPTATTTSYDYYPSSDGACRTSTFLEGWDDHHTGPVTTLCDGTPRALGPRETVTSYYPGTGPCSTLTATYTNIVSLYREPEAPDCTLNTQECIPIWQTYSSRSSQYYNSITTVSTADTNSPIDPWSCPSTQRTYPEDPCTACHFLPDTATVFYWPVVTASGDLCHQDGSTIPATPTGSGPNTAVVDGNTFISPSIYVSFTSIYAWSNRRAHPGSQCGEYHTDAIISVDPVSVSSVRSHRNAKYPIIGTAYPFNFAEFMPQEVGNYTMPLIPWPQYRGGSQCPIYDPSCTMIRDDYMPFLDLPEAVRAIDPLWTKCDAHWYIPPVTLVPLTAATVVLPTPVGEAKVMAATAVPESAVAVPTPEATGW